MAGSGPQPRLTLPRGAAGSHCHVALHALQQRAPLAGRLQGKPWANLLGTGSTDIIVEDDLDIVDEIVF